MARGKKIELDADQQLSAIIGAGARRARKRLGLTQEGVGQLLDITAEFYARIERGHALPSVTTFRHIVTALEVDANELFGLTDGSGAAAAATASQTPIVRQSDPPELKRIIKRLRRTSRATLRLVTLLIKELEERFTRVDGESEQGDGSPSPE